jgi:DNA invertase Pin-like site-specific DNA recombinase
MRGGISERTKAGLRRAVKDGATLGRRPVVVDVAKTHKMQREGMGLRGIAEKLGCSVNTLRGALQTHRKSNEFGDRFAGVIPASRQ